MNVKRILAAAAVAAALSAGLLSGVAQAAPPSGNNGTHGHTQSAHHGPGDWHWG
jgi:hypothetical protein